MSDWYLNRLTVRGKPHHLERMLDAVRRDDGLPLDFERVRPTPPADYLDHLGIDFGYGAHAGWLLWRDAYWGTKWSPEAEDFRLEGTPEDGELTFFFETANGVPVPLIEELARQHLRLTFELVHVDHGNYIAGCRFCSLGMRMLHVHESGEEAADLLGRLDWIDQRDVMLELLS